MILANKTDNLDNNFDFLRFVAATIVMFVHSFTLFGQAVPAYISYIPQGVPIFFVISGFLIAKSWLDNPNPFVFFKKRILRIFPALIVVVLFCALILGPLLTNLSLNEYFSAKDFHRYIRNIYLYKIYYQLPAVFTNVPYPNAVNGSLWSLPVEFSMYIMVAVLGLFKIFQKSITFLSLLLLSLFLIFHVYTGEWSDKNFIFCQGVLFFQLAITFLIGSFLYIKRNSIVLSFPIFLGCVLIWLTCVNTPLFQYVQWFTLPYIIIYIAYAKLPFINNWGKFGDFSYGIYVWAFPVQQTIVYLLKPYLNILTYNLIVFPITILFAIISYYLVEKPALKLKKNKLIEPLKNFILKEK